MKQVTKKEYMTVLTMLWTDAERHTLAHSERERLVNMVASYNFHVFGTVLGYPKENDKT